MEPRFTLPRNILEGIGKIPRFNLDFAKLPKAPIMPTAPVQTKLPVQAMPVQRTSEPVAPPVSTVPATTATQPVRQVANDAPFASGIRRIETGLDPLTKQLLFGLDGRGGFIPGAMRAAEKVFFDEQGQPVVIEEQVAGLTPDQLIVTGKQ